MECPKPSFLIRDLIGDVLQTSKSSAVLNLWSAAPWGSAILMTGVRGCSLKSFLVMTLLKLSGGRVRESLIYTRTPPCKYTSGFGESDVLKRVATCDGPLNYHDSNCVLLSANTSCWAV
ncbi:homeobox protein koza-like [Aphis craccivora]|uniref:Homeobox protein koza-like n=1 Tax=Aphis craccivora TaxID=307492 RepID=A0A6G0ZAH9_APHCR|nr:homeobox protein koza-like [Aphis craccivora]